MAAGDPTADEFAKWLSPNAALKVRAPHISEIVAKTTLLRLLQGDGLKSAAAVMTAEFVDQIKKAEEPSAILARHWADFPSDPPSTEAFWQTGVVRFYLRRHTSRPARYSNEIIAINAFGVRLEPTEVRRALDAPEVPGVAPPAPPETDEGGSEKKPRVPDAMLREWFDLYRKAYPRDLGEGHAIQSATGMFPNHSVSRSRIRELRGPQKRGRKSDSGE